MSETKVSDTISNIEMVLGDDSVEKRLQELCETNCDETGIFENIHLANCYVKCFEGLCIDKEEKETISKVSDYSLGSWWLETSCRNVSVDIHEFSGGQYCVVPQFVGKYVVRRTNARIKDYREKTSTTSKSLK